MTPMSHVVLLTAAAALTATLSGMTGVGGGTLLIAIILAAGLPPVIAIPLHAAVQVVSNFSRTVAYVRDVEWSAAGWFLVGAVPAPFVLAPLVAWVNPDAIRLALAVFILLILFPRWLRGLRLGGRGGFVLAGVFGAGFGAVLGATGTLVGSLLMRADWPKKTLIGTLAMCMVLAHGLKIAAFSAFGYGVFDYWRLLLPMAVAVVIGTVVGRQLVGLFSEVVFRHVFRLILAVLAAKLFYDGLGGLL